MIIALHGFNDYRRAFDRIGTFMAIKKIHLIAYDQRGFGENPNPGHWAGTTVMTDDLAEMVASVRRTQPTVPLYILGSSMGAAVAIATQARHPDLDIDGFILAGPAVWGGEALNPAYRAILWLMRRIAPGLSVTGRGLGKQASDNIGVLIGLGRDPLVIKETRIDALGGLVDLMTEARAALGTIEGRFFVARGALDEIVPVETQAEAAWLLHDQECMTALYPDGWHMILRDHQAAVIYRDILAWIEGVDHLPSGFQMSCATAIEDLAHRPGS